MTEQQTNENAQKASENQPDPAQAMQFNLVGHYARDISLECPKSVMEAKTSEVKVGMDIGVSCKKLEDGQAEASIKLRCEAKNETGDVCYLAETEYVGQFSWSGFSDEQLIQVLSIDGASLIYPFARQVLMSLVQSAGYRTPMLDIVNFHSLFVQAQQQAQAEALKNAEAAGAA